MNKIDLLNDIISIYGFEHPFTIGFSKLLDDPDFPYWALKAIADSLIKNPVYALFD